MTLLIFGAGATIVKAALATGLWEKPEAVAIALTVSFVLTTKGPPYTSEDVVGVVPSVV